MDGKNIITNYFYGLLENFPFISLQLFCIPSSCYVTFYLYLMILDYIVCLCGQKIVRLVYFHLTIQPVQSNVTFMSSNVCHVKLLSMQSSMIMFVSELWMNG